MVREQRTERRSGCPLNASLETFGDRWSLLIVRDLMFNGRRTFKEFSEAGEGIATNILADRLERLQAEGIVVKKPDQTDGRRVRYGLTDKGIDLAPVLVEMIVWGARHYRTAAPPAIIARMTDQRDQVLAEIRARWSEETATPAG